MADNTMKPKIRFKGFNEDWEQRKFGDVGSVSMCKRIFKDETFVEGDIPFYKIGTFGGMPDAYINREMFEEYKRKFAYPDEGDILLSASGTIGRVVEYKGEEAYFQDSNIVWLNHDESINNMFLKYLYPTVKWDGIEGSTIKRLYNDNFLRTRFMMPSTLEQEKLGEYFGQLDNLITFHQQKCDKLKNIKKSMLQKMFPQGGEKVPELRFAGFTGDWEQRKLGDMASSFDYGLNAAAKEYDGQNVYIRITDIDDDSHSFIRDSITSPDIDLTNADDYKLTEGDILFARTGASVGKSYIYQTTDGQMYFAGFLIRVRIRSEYDAGFVYQNTLTKNYNNYIAVTSRRSGQPGVNAQEYAAYEIICPSKDEQIKIGKYFANLDKLIVLHQRKCDKLKNIKKSLLQKMFV